MFPLRLLSTFLSLAAFVTLSGCIKSTNGGDGDVNSAGRGTAEKQAEEAPEFKLALRFDGRDTPYGRFEEPSVCTGGGKVFVADRAYSYVYVFDWDGNFERAFGSGFKVEDYVLDDDALLDSHIGFKEEEELPPELKHEISLHRFFRAEDIAYSAGHVFVLSSYFPSLSGESRMVPVILEYTAEGQFTRERSILGMISPRFMDFDQEQNVVVSDSTVNEIWIGNSEGSARYTDLKLFSGVRAFYSTVLKKREDPSALSAYLAMVSNTGIGRDQYGAIGGVAIYTPVLRGELSIEDGKVIVCDTGNDRIKVTTLAGQLLEVIDGAEGGERRFSSPVDVAVLSDGTIAILEGGKGGIVLMKRDYTFGVRFGVGEFDDPSRIHADSEGGIWVADRGTGEILYFTRGEIGA